MQNDSYDFELAWSTIKGISNDYAIKYMKKTPIFSIGEGHFTRRKYFYSFISCLIQLKFETL